jgi:hypothetical protein
VVERIKARMEMRSDALEARPELRGDLFSPAPGVSRKPLEDLRI